MSPNAVGVLTILLWSSLAVVLVFASSIPPFQIGAMTWFIAFVVMVFYLKARGEKILPHFRRPLSDYLFVGMGVTAYLLLIYSAFHFAPPFEANTLNYTWPIFLTIFLSVFQGALLSPVKIGGLLLGFCGCVLLFGYRYSDHTFQGLTVGHFMALLAAILWALYSCFAKGRDYPTAFIAPIFLVSSILSLIGHLIWEKTVVPDESAAIAIFIIGVSRISYVLWDYAIRQGDREFISSLAYFIPLASTMFMIAFGFGASSLIVAIAAFMIVGGCILVNWRQIHGILLKRHS